MWLFLLWASIPSSEITEWISEPNGGETAICPKCGIDAVLTSTLPIEDSDFMKEMHNFWFD